MTPREWLNAVADKAAWGAKYRAAFLRYADRLGPAFTASTFRPDSAAAVASRLVAFPTLDELKASITAAMPDVLAARGAEPAVAVGVEADDLPESMWRRRLEKGASVATTLSLVRQLHGQEAWDRLAKDYAPREHREEMRDRQERAERRTASLPPVRVQRMPSAYQRSSVSAQAPADPVVEALAARRREVNERATEARLQVEAAAGNPAALRRLDAIRRREADALPVLVTPHRTLQSSEVIG